MFGLGFGEIAIIAVIGLVFLGGAKRLPELGQSMGKALRGFKKGLTEDEEKELEGSENEKLEQ